MASGLCRCIVLGPAGVISPGSPQDYRVGSNGFWLVDSGTRWVRLGRLAVADAVRRRARSAARGGSGRADRTGARGRDAHHPHAVPLPDVGERHERDDLRRARRDDAGPQTSSQLAGLPLLTVVPTPDTGAISTTSSSTTTTPCVATLSGSVSAHVLCAKVTTVASPARSTAEASVADATVGIAGIPTVAIGAVKSTSTTACSGSSGTTTIASIKVGSTVVTIPPNVAPNTVINVGVVRLVLNEQIPFSTPDDGLTVNAVHVTANVLGVAANVIVASSESDIGNCP